LLSAPRLSLREAADKCAVSLPTVRRWTTTGVRGVVLPSVHVGGRRFILAADLAAFMEEIQEGGARS
jgi:hypothetical protein